MILHGMVLEKYLQLRFFGNTTICKLLELHHRELGLIFDSGQFEEDSAQRLDALVNCIRLRLIFALGPDFLEATERIDLAQGVS